MKTIAFPIIAAAIMIAPTLAWATFDVTDRIRSIDARAHEIQLRNGQYYRFLTDVKFDSFKVGDMVRIRVHAYDNNIGLMNHAEYVEKAN